MAKVSTLHGISFPFRISPSGGVAMTSVSSRDVSHIVEKIELLLTTYVGDRTMEQDWCSQVDTLVFKNGDTPELALLEYYVRNTLRKLEDLIIITKVFPHREEGAVYVDITFTLKEYDKVYVLNNVRVGEDNE